MSIEAMEQWAHLNEVVELQLKIEDQNTEIARLRATLDKIIARDRKATYEPGVDGIRIAGWVDGDYAKLARAALEPTP